MLLYLVNYNLWFPASRKPTRGSTSPAIDYRSEPHGVATAQLQEPGQNSLSPLLSPNSYFRPISPASDSDMVENISIHRAKKSSASSSNDYCDDVFEPIPDQETKAAALSNGHGIAIHTELDLDDTCQER